jgi:hypothetical protein
LHASPPLQPAPLVQGSTQVLPEVAPPRSTQSMEEEHPLVPHEPSTQPTVGSQI